MLHRISICLITYSALVLGGCGQMGPLYMPTEETTVAPATEEVDQSAAQVGDDAPAAEQ